MDIKGYRLRVVKVLKKQGRWSEELDTLATSLARAIMVEEKASDQIADLDEVTITEESRYGSRLVPHPAFKVQKDAQATIIGLVKQLGITAAEVKEGSDADPMVELTKKVIGA